MLCIIRIRCLLALMLILFVGNVFALPAKVIILRHGEKSTSTGPSGIYGLCSIGWERSLALSSTYLGKGAVDTLLPKNGPAAFFALTPHTIELASPAAVSWGAELQNYSVVALPSDLQTSAQLTTQLVVRTQEAATDVMKNPKWNNKVVVIVWEHEYIANSKIEKEATGKVTLRQLLNLDQIAGDPVPKDWEDDNYDFFWIVEYGKRSSKIPTRFTAIKQSYPGTGIPSNDWGVWVALPQDCENSSPPSTISN